MIRSILSAHFELWFYSFARKRIHHIELIYFMKNIKIKKSDFLVEGMSNGTDHETKTTVVFNKNKQINGKSKSECCFMSVCMCLWKIEVRVLTMKIKVGLGHAIDPKVGVVEHPPCCYSNLVQFPLCYV